MAFKRKNIIISGGALIAVILIVAFSFSLSGPKAEKYYVVKKGEFEAVLNCKGEVNGLKAIEIRPPKVLSDRDLRLWSMKIVDLAQDGKSVKKGDFIVQLDANQVMEGMREVQQSLEKEMADLNNAKIDSAVNLTEKREAIKNALLDLEYNKIDLEQSKYESEAYQRKAQMTYQKAENEIEKKRRDYILEQNKLKMQVMRSEEKVEKSNEMLQKFQQAMQSTRITAPEDGIVIFGKSWEGKKFSKDDNIYTYDFAPAIATLPDMSSVISETYVKEIDIAKVKVGDSVRVTFDALEGTSIPGSIKNIARMGEDHKDFDMKVFKVIIQLDHSNEGLKPAMSSNNEIILENQDNVISIPLTAVFNESGLNYVYLKTNDGVVKQPVKTGLENEEAILVEDGLREGDRILLEPPKDENLLTKNN